MEKIKIESCSAYFERLAKAASTLTQEQVDACAYVMGSSGGGWRPDNIRKSLELEKRWALSLTDKNS